MSREHFWPNIRALAAFLDESREAGEFTLNVLEDDLKKLTPDQQKEISEEMIIIAQLSRLQMRMQE